MDSLPMSSAATLSPASTYGGTLTDRNSFPGTPLSGLPNATEVLDSNDTTMLSDLFDAHMKPPRYDLELALASKARSTHMGDKPLALSSSGSSPARLSTMVDEITKSCGDDKLRPFIQGSHDKQDDVFLAKSDTGLPPNVPTGPKAMTYSPRQDRQGQMVTEDNAQAHYKPEACIFLANLPCRTTDEELHEVIFRKFSRFGECHVKVKRDRGMPVAFVQYHNIEDATTALKNGDGLSILGRRCRTERAKAPRGVYVSRRDGEMPTEEEVSLLLSEFGELEKIWCPSETEREIYRLQPGYFVRFVYYQDAVEAISNLHDLPKYHVESQRSPKEHSGAFDRASVSHMSQPTATAPTYNPLEHDNKTLWVGGLPDNITRGDLCRVFGGRDRQITHIDLRIRNAAIYGHKYLSYACIHYTDSRAAYEAANTTYNQLRLFNGRHVRVQFARKTHSIPSTSPEAHGQRHSGYTHNASCFGFGTGTLENRRPDPPPNCLYAHNLESNRMVKKSFSYRGYRTDGGFTYNYDGHAYHDNASIGYAPMESGAPFGYYPLLCPGVTGSYRPGSQAPLPLPAAPSFPSERHSLMP